MELVVQVTAQISGRRTKALMMMLTKRRMRKIQKTHGKMRQLRTKRRSQTAMTLTKL